MSDLFARFIFAHEFFHLWNGKSIRPKTTEDGGSRKGFTNIYAMKTLYRIGAISEAELFGVLEKKRAVLQALFDRRVVRESLDA
ncbi:MAG: hypothetical protein IPM25_20265 [Chloracidobacterium sp.]|nr:hypothetical protein [Chloracidobacterium sp.]